MDVVKTGQNKFSRGVCTVAKGVEGCKGVSKILALDRTFVIGFGIVRERISQPPGISNTNGW